MLDTSKTTVHSIEKITSAEFHDVNFQIRGQTLLRNLNCAFEQSGTTVLMGPNGAGKSLFIRVLAGLLSPTHGRVVCQTNNHKHDPEIAILFQQPMLLRRSTYQNIEYVLRRSSSMRGSLEANVLKALKDARLFDRANAPARNLSGGERQRLALARALATKPRILLMDEVTANLDPASIHIVEEMTREAVSSGAKVIFITHDIRQAKRIADDIIFLHQGQILAHKSTRDFFREPGSDEAQAYLDGRLPNQSFQTKYKLEE